VAARIHRRAKAWSVSGLCEASPVKIGILGGTGPAGRGLAARLTAGGQKVFLGSRDPAKAEAAVRKLVEQWGPRMNHIEPGVNADVAEHGEIVVLGTTARGTVATAAEHAGRLAGKPVVSMANAMRRVGSSFELVPTEEGSIAQAVQKAAPAALVAAALHHIPAAALLDLDTEVLHGDVAVVSDDLEAMRATQALVSAMPELRPLDGGPLENAIGLEAFCAVLLTVNLRYGGKATLRLMPAH
jgi:8-hydroxy-5-deazaflavin:NADPH oxidoreductase